MTDKFESDPKNPQQPGQPHDTGAAGASASGAAPQGNGAPADMSYHPTQPAAPVEGAQMNPQPTQVPEGQPAPYPAMNTATAPQPPKRRFGVRQIISLVALVLLLGFGAYAIVQRVSDNNTMKVGNCVQITQNSSKDEDNSRKKVGCDTDQSWTITQAGSSSAKCSEYEETFEYVDKKNNNVTKALCLMPNMQQGKCYSAKEPTTFPAIVGFRAVDCSDSSADIKVTKKIDSDDTKQCQGSTEKPLAYNTSSVHRVYCVTKAS